MLAGLRYAPESPWVVSIDRTSACVYGSPRAFVRSCVRACVLRACPACVRACVFRALDDMKLGLSGEEAHQVVLHLEREGHMKDWRVSIQGFLDVHGGGER